MNGRWLKLASALALVPLVQIPTIGAAQAATLNVVAGDAASLRAQITAAGDGDVVAIPAGLYVLPCGASEEQNNASGDLDIVNKSITLRGPVTGTATIRPANGCAERVIDIIDTGLVNTVVIENLTITGGRPSAGSGGGINAGFSTATSLTIRNSIITDNEAGDGGVGSAPSGGGVHLNSLGTLLITGSTISDNSVGLGGGTGADSARGWSAGGGGVSFRGFSSPTGSVTITNTTVSGNTGGVASNGGGGGIWLDSRDVTLTNVDIVDNEVPSERAVGNGAGLAISPLVQAAVDVTITGGTISGNTIAGPDDPAANVAGGDGGGVWINAPVINASITGTSFSDNSAGDATGTFIGGDGGNLFMAGFGGASPSSIDLDDVALANGRAGDGADGDAGSGGGAYLAPAALGSSVTIDGSQFSGNNAGSSNTDGEGGNGGGLDVRLQPTGATGSVTITDTVFEDNQSGSSSTGTDPGNGGFGGGAYIAVVSAAGPAAQVAVTDSTFTGNSTGAGGTGTAFGGRGGDGGGLAVFATRTVITDTDFEANSTGAGGSGPIGARAGDGGGALVGGEDITITGGSFTDNTTGDGGDGTSTFGSSGGSGGGAHIDVVGDVTITGTSFNGNVAGDGGDAGSGAPGAIAGAGGFGGGVDIDHGTVAATVSITDVTMTSNRAGDGGDAPNIGDLRAGPGGPGGGLAVTGSGPLAIEIEDSTFRTNSSGSAGTGATATSAFGGSGGGVYVRVSDAAATLDVTRTVIANNSTGDGGTATGFGNSAWPGGSGGGVYALVGDAGAGGSNAGTISIERSSITGNTTGDGAAGGSGGTSSRGGPGGGAWLRGGNGGAGSITVSDTTISNNITGSDLGGSVPSGDGGGLHVDETTELTLTSSTLTDNEGASGDDLLTASDATFTSNVFGASQDPANRESCQIAGLADVSSGGHNVETDGDTCGLRSNTDVRDVDGAVLGPLQNNGGVGLSRLPRLLGAAAPLVDSNTAGSCPTSTDQLGTSRPQADGCDTGAVEVELGPITAVDDVIAVDGNVTTLDLTANDDRAGFTTGDMFVTIVAPAPVGIFSEDGEWRFRSPQSSGAFVTFTYRACLGASDFCDEAEVTLVPESTSRFVSLPPTRIFDTRPSEPAPGPKGFVPGDSTIAVQITGVAGIPTSGVSAVAMNVTATATDGPGFVTVSPTGSPRPLASNLNIVGSGETIPNFVIVPVGADGKVSIYTLPGTHLLGDVAGYFTENGVSLNPTAPGAAAGRLVPLTPERAFDTRPGTSAPGPKGILGDDSTIDVQIAGRAGVPSDGAAAVVMNLTATGSTQGGFVTAFPSGTERPLASNLNLTGPGQTAPNLVIVPLGDNGRISLYARSGVHLLGDVTGYITDDGAPVSLSGLFVPNGPGRAFDTREGVSPPGNKGRLDAGDTISVRFTANAGTPATGVGAVVMNATAVRAGGPGFVTIWPDGEPQPVASTLNLRSVGQTRPNAAILPIGDGGQINFFTRGELDLLTDVFGWFLA